MFSAKSDLQSSLIYTAQRTVRRACICAFVQMFNFYVHSGCRFISSLLFRWSHKNNIILYLLLFDYPFSFDLIWFASVKSSLGSSCARTFVWVCVPVSPYTDAWHVWACKSHQMNQANSQCALQYLHMLANVLYLCSRYGTAISLFEYASLAVWTDFFLWIQFIFVRD